MQIQSKYNTGVKLLLPVDRGFLVKTRSEAQSRVSRPYESRFSPYKFLFFLVFSCLNFVLLVKNFRFFSKPTCKFHLFSFLSSFPTFLIFLLFLCLLFLPIHKSTFFPFLKFFPFFPLLYSSLSTSTLTKLFQILAKCR